MKYKLILLLGLLTVISSLCFAQQKKCELEIKDSPSFRGVKLGMNKAEVELFLGSSFEVSESTMLLIPQEVALILPDKVDSLTAKELQKYIYPFSSSPPNGFYDVPNGAFESHFSPNETQKHTERFKDISRISFGFYQDRVHIINIQFKKDVFSDTAEKDFYSNISALLKLPEGVLSEGVAGCNGFYVFAKNSKNWAFILLKNTVTSLILEEKARQTLKEAYEKFKNKKAN